jgi:hypothetical protein
MLMYIMTANGWKQLSPPMYAQAKHVPTLLEVMGIDMSYDAVAAMANYANGSGRGNYFTYRKDGTAYQSKGAINPLSGVLGEADFD